MNGLIYIKGLDSSHKTGCFPYKDRKVFYVLLEEKEKDRKAAILAYVKNWNECLKFPESCELIETEDFKEIKRRLERFWGKTDFISLVGEKSFLQGKGEVF